MAGDFNGDGKLDLAGVGGEGLVVLLGNGDGTFQAPIVGSVGSGRSLATADLNGDGKLDILQFNFPLLWVHLGNGDGTFGSVPGYMTNPNGSTGLAIADFNLDGKPDVAAGSYVMLGNGDGTFQGQSAVVLTFPPIAAAIGDFDKNGTQDIAVISYSDPLAVDIYLNDGTGILTLGHSYTLQGATPSAITTADLNGDGDLDLVVVGPPDYSVLLGNGDGSFQGPFYYPQTIDGGCGPCPSVMGDFNNDHKPDLAIGLDGNANQDFALLLGNGDGTFSAPAYYFDGGAAFLAAADFNGDGNLDLAAGGSGTGGPQTGLLLGNGDGTFQPANFGLGAYEAVFPGDFNNDGKPDLLGGDSQGDQVLLGNGNGIFKPAAPNSGINLSRAALGDINGDGILDVVGTSIFNSTVNVTLGNGDGSFGPLIEALPDDFENQFNFYFVQAADMNGDGKPDLIVAGGGEIFILINTTKSVPGTNFSPSSANFPSQAVGTTSSPVLVILTNTGALALKVTGVAITGAGASQFSQANNCTSIPPSESCTIQVTFSPTSVGNVLSSLAITDNAAGSPQSVPLVGVGANGSGSELGLSIPNGGSNSQTVQAGATATYMLSIGGKGWSGQVSLGCTGAPSAATCSFPSGASVNVSGGSATQFKVTVSTTARTMAVNAPGRQLSTPWLWAMVAAGLVMLPSSRKGKRIVRQGIAVLTLLFVCSCGGGSGLSGSANGTLAGTYLLTVTATAGSVHQSVSLTLTVL